MVATQIEYCAEHYNELMQSLLDRQLHGYISSSPEEMVEKLESGQPDAGLDATSAITSAAIQLFGPDALLAAGGCPVCAFTNIIEHVADHMAIKYGRKN